MNTSFAHGKKCTTGSKDSVFDFAFAKQRSLRRYSRTNCIRVRTESPTACQSTKKAQQSQASISEMSTQY